MINNSLFYNNQNNKIGFKSWGRILFSVIGLIVIALAGMILANNSRSNAAAPAGFGIAIHGDDPVTYYTGPRNEYIKVNVRLTVPSNYIIQPDLRVLHMSVHPLPSEAQQCANLNQDDGSKGSNDEARTTGIRYHNFGVLQGSHRQRTGSLFISIPHNDIRVNNRSHICVGIPYQRVGSSTTLYAYVATATEFSLSLPKITDVVVQSADYTAANIGERVRVVYTFNRPVKVVKTNNAAVTKPHIRSNITMWQNNDWLRDNHNNDATNLFFNGALNTYSNKMTFEFAPGIDHLRFHHNIIPGQKWNDEWAATRSNKINAAIRLWARNTTGTIINNAYDIVDEQGRKAAVTSSAVLASDARISDFEITLDTTPIVTLQQTAGGFDITHTPTTYTTSTTDTTEKNTITADWSLRVSNSQPQITDKCTVGAAVTSGNKAQVKTSMPSTPDNKYYCVHTTDIFSRRVVSEWKQYVSDDTTNPIINHAISNNILTLTVTDADSGYKTGSLRWGNLASGQQCNAGFTGSLSNTNPTITIDSSLNNQVICVKAEDNVGNVVYKSITLQYNAPPDRTNPIIAHTISNNRLTLTVTDTDSGYKANSLRWGNLASGQQCNAGFTGRLSNTNPTITITSSLNNQVICVKAEDNAGNVAYKSITLQYNAPPDRTNPTIIHTVNNNQVTLTVTDADSGYKTGSLRWGNLNSGQCVASNNNLNFANTNPTITITSSLNNQVICVKAEDNAGNVAYKSITLQYIQLASSDRVVPVITHTISNNRLTLTVTDTDSGYKANSLRWGNLASGQQCNAGFTGSLSNTNPTITITSSLNNQVICVKAEDNAGNVAYKSITLQYSKPLDRTDPTITHTMSNNQLTLTVTDADSGYKTGSLRWTNLNSGQCVVSNNNLNFANTNPTITITSSLNNQVICVKAEDNAGNVAYKRITLVYNQPQSTTIRTSDRTDPVITHTVNDNQLTLTVTDADSGYNKGTFAWGKLKSNQRCVVGTDARLSNIGTTITITITITEDLDNQVICVKAEDNAGNVAYKKIILEYNPPTTSIGDQGDTEIVTVDNTKQETDKDKIQTTVNCHNLPDNWPQLSTVEKIRLNPCNCAKTTHIKMDNGQCLNQESSTNNDNQTSTTIAENDNQATIHKDETQPQKTLPKPTNKETRIITITTTGKELSDYKYTVVDSRDDCSQATNYVALNKDKTIKVIQEDLDKNRVVCIQGLDKNGNLIVNHHVLSDIQTDNQAKTTHKIDNQVNSNNNKGLAITIIVLVMILVGCLVILIVFKKQSPNRF